MTIVPISDTARRRLMAALFTSQSLFSAATIAAFTLTPIIAVDLRGSDSAAGIPITVTLLGRAAAAYPLGWVLDRVGRRWGLSLGYLLGVVGMVLSAAAVILASFIGLLAGAALLGMSRAAVEQSRFAAAEVQPLPRRAKAIGLIVFAGTVGAVGGPLLVAPSERLALLSGVPGGTGPFLVAGLLLFLAMLVIFLFLRPDPLQVGLQIDGELAAANGTGMAVMRARPLGEIFAGSIVRLAVLAMVIGQLVMGLLMVIAPVHMSHNNHDTAAISWVIMAHTLGMFGLSGVTGWLIARVGHIPMIVAGSFTLVAACFIAPLSLTVPVLALSLFLLGLGWNFCFIAGSSLLSDALEANERGRAQGANEMMVALASGLGSLGTGLLFEQGGIIAVSGAGIVFSLLLVGTVGWQVRPRVVVHAGD